MSELNIPFIDLFSGAGGLSVGFEQAGFTAVLANDNDQYACETYATNHPDADVVNSDVEDLDGSSIRERTGEAEIPLVIGGPNCQGVSLRGKRDPDDPKNKMFYHFARLISELRPEFFVMENVPGLMHRHNRELITDIFHEFEEMGYTCGGEVLSAADYGVPQLRYRFILVGSLSQSEIAFPDPTHRSPVGQRTDLFAGTDSRPFWRTTNDAIKDLPQISNGGGADVMEYSDAVPPNDFQAYCRGSSDLLYNHVCHETPEHNIRLIQHIPPGGNWRDIPEDLRPERFRRVALKDHTTTYGRLEWDMPSRTITTYFNNISSGAFTHPDQHRGISVREGARFQSFPDNHVFQGTLARQYRQVGNAVPPLMAYFVATAVRSMLRGDVDDGAFHIPAVALDRRTKRLRIVKPLKGMRFNLDKHLV